MGATYSTHSRSNWASDYNHHIDCKETEHHVQIFFRARGVCVRLVRSESELKKRFSTLLSNNFTSWNIQQGVVKALVTMEFQQCLSTAMYPIKYYSSY